MPRELTDSEGNKVEVPDEGELKSLNEKAQQAEELATKIKELEEGANPDWRKVRQEQKELEKKLKDAESARDVLKTEAAKQGVKFEEDRKFSADDINKMAEEKANQVFLSRFRALQVSQFGERAKEVDALVGKLSAGEELTEAKLTENIQIAARALGLESNKPNANMHISGSSGYIPSPKELGDQKQKFNETPEGQRLAGALGIDERSLIGVIAKPEANAPKQ